MYEKHFRLNRRPFCALAQGETVFVGHQVSALTAEMDKALSAADAVIAVSAPVGGGKSTAVRHALQGMGDAVKIVNIDRLLRQSDETRESSLEQLGADEVPPGTVQRIKLLREKLADCERNEIRTVFVVEDASRTGAETLCDLEALTAADTGVCRGAAIVVMGDPTLEEFLSSTLLVRLNQRLRLRYDLEPLSREELRDYLKHSVKSAGADLDDIFEPGAHLALHAVSRGLPRLANRIADAALTTAAERGLTRVTAELIEQALTCEPAGPGETGRTETLPNAADQNSRASGRGDETDGSDLAAGTDGGRRGPDQLSSQSAATAGHLRESATNLPEWDREPTLAQLRPDIEALEKAMAVEKPSDDEEPAAETDIPVLTETSVEAFNETSTEVMPEITLDREIQASIEEATEDIKRAEVEAAAKAAEDAAAEKTIDLASTGELTPETLAPASGNNASGSDSAGTDTSAAQQPAASRQQHSDQAASVANHSLEDGDDGYMGDSAFGAVFSDIADEPPANENLELGVPELVEPCETDGEPDLPDISAGAPVSPSPGLDEEASKRLATVRALNGMPNASPNRSPGAEPDMLADTEVPPQPVADEEDIDTIEVQIGTSMTQTFKALNIEDDDEKHHPKKFAFSRRFRKA